MIGDFAKSSDPRSQVLRTFGHLIRRTNGELETAFEGQSHRAETIARIVDERKVLVVCPAKLRRVVTDDDRALAQMGRDQEQRRLSHRRPDVDEHEVYRSLHVDQRVSQIPFTEVNEIGQAGFGEMTARDLGLFGLVLSPDDDGAKSAVVETGALLVEVIAYGSSKKQRRDAE